jgi:hypothetical protein
MFRESACGPREAPAVPAVAVSLPGAPSHRLPLEGSRPEPGRLAPRA